MKSKILNLLLIVTSLLGYLEWGGGNASFLFQAEGEVLSKMWSEPSSVLHPFIVFPILAQLNLDSKLLKELRKTTRGKIIRCCEWR